MLGAQFDMPSFNFVIALHRLSVCDLGLGS